jgi:glucose/arabinose dehydrogenase
VRLFLASLLLFTSLAFPATTRAADDPRFVVETLTETLELPTGFAFTPDGRALIAEKAGRVKIWKDGVLYGRPLIDIRDEVTDFNDRGLLGIAVDPEFARNGYVYLSFVHDPPDVARDSAEPRKGRVVRYTVVGDVVRPNSARVILDDFFSDTMQHGPGALRFGPDGALFAAFGDGALSQGVQKISLRAQSLDSIQGKLLRMDRDGNGLPGNPHFDAKNPRSARSRIWARGLRNPFRFDIDPASGIPFVADVGWNAFEWIARATAGANFGWPCVEGSRDVPEFQAMPECAGVSAAKSTPKALVYAHDGAPAAISGIAFGPSTLPDPTLRGRLFFADYSKFFVRSAAIGADGALTDVAEIIKNIGEPVDLSFGRDGALYVMSHQSRGFQRVRLKEAPTPRWPSDAPKAPDAFAIRGAANGDVVRPGAQLVLRADDRATVWSARLLTGRRARVMTETVGSAFTVTLPGAADFTNSSRVEVLASRARSGGAIDAARLTLYPPHSDGYIRNWYLLGNSLWRDLNADTLNGEAAYVMTPGDKRAWLVRSASGNIDLRALITPSPGTFGVLADKASAYAFIWIDVPTDRTGLLGMNSDDGIAVWLNGAEIWRNKVGRTMPNDLRDIDLPPITLKKGRNALLIKVDTYGGDWQFKARVLNPDGSIMRDAVSVGLAEADDRR